MVEWLLDSVDDAGQYTEDLKGALQMRGQVHRWAVLVVFAWGLVAQAVDARSITFWTMNYREPRTQTELLNELAAKFKAETGITVNWEIINWAQADQ